MTGNCWRFVLLLGVLAIVTAAPSADLRAAGATVQIGWLSRTVKRTLPLTYLDQPPEDEGIQGARLGIADNNTTGHFTGQSFDLVESIAPEGGDVDRRLPRPRGQGRASGRDRPRCAATADDRRPAGRRPRHDLQHRCCRRPAARRRLPRRHPAFAAEPGDAGRRPRPISRGQAVAQSAACRRPQRRRQGISPPTSATPH